MPRFAANLSLLFTEYPLRDRFAHAKAAGFTGAELLFPYELSANALKACLEETGLELALINMPVPDWQAGGRGCAAIPGRAFREQFAQALDYAETCGVQHIHILSGIAQDKTAYQTYLNNLSWAVERAPTQSLTIEPINSYDMPGYFLNDFKMAQEVLSQVDRPNLNLQFDAYHAHKITGDVMGIWDRYGAGAVHVQIASAEGRHEPIAGAIDYPAFFARLDQEGYQGWVSAEYFPKSDTKEGLNWLDAARKKI